MKLNPSTILEIIFVALIVLAAVVLFIKLWKEEKAKNQEIYFGRYNYASAFFAFCKTNNDFRGEHYDTLTDLIEKLKVMPGRALEDIEVLQTEADRCFVKVILQRHLDNPVLKVRRAKRPAKVEMIER